MAHILHYVRENGPGEYIVITEDEDTQETKEFHRVDGFIFRISYELDDVGSLPTDTILSPGF